MLQGDGCEADPFAAMWEPAGNKHIYFPQESKDSQKLLIWLHHLVNSIATSWEGQMKTACCKVQTGHIGVLLPERNLSKYSIL